MREKEEKYIKPSRNKKSKVSLSMKNTCLWANAAYLLSLTARLCLASSGGSSLKTFTSSGEEMPVGLPYTRSPRPDAFLTTWQRWRSETREDEWIEIRWGDVQTADSKNAEEPL